MLLAKEDELYAAPQRAAPSQGGGGTVSSRAAQPGCGGGGHMKGVCAQRRASALRGGRNKSTGRPRTRQPPKRVRSGSAPPLKRMGEGSFQQEGLGKRGASARLDSCACPANENLHIAN